MIHTVEPGFVDYPPGLLDLEKPPRIHVLGTLPEPPWVAVVGTRRCTRYGTSVAFSYGSAIALAGWVTSSGLARGIDVAAHRGALAADGQAVAVLGCGVDVCYPVENRPVYDRILAAGGAIVSEYPAGTPPDRWRFPARNRLIAAMSVAVVVVEAGVTGGALITARLAAEMGRPVFVTPGDVDRPASEGCNRLLKDGAHPVLGSEDLMEEVQLVAGPPRSKTTMAEIPPKGAGLEELAGIWGLPMPETLARVGKLELEGKARRIGELVLPT